jgi:hypothetical protein
MESTKVTASSQHRIVNFAFKGLNLLLLRCSFFSFSSTTPINSAHTGMVDHDELIANFVAVSGAHS